MVHIPIVNCMSCVSRVKGTSKSLTNVKSLRSHNASRGSAGLGHLISNCDGLATVGAADSAVTVKDHTRILGFSTTP